MEEFRKRDLHIEYQKEIEEWFIYLDQQEFGRELKEKISKEIDRFLKTRESVEELMERVFGKTEWEIEFIEGIEDNYLFKSLYY